MYQLGDIAIYFFPWSLALFGLALAGLAYAAFSARRRLWRLPGILAAAVAPLLMAATYTGLPIALTNAQMGLYPSWQYFAVLRLGVNTVGDAPAQWFVPSGTACSISGGDIGSEVPTKDGGCFNAATALFVNPREFGAKGDGTTNDTTALQNAINAIANNAVLSLGAGQYCVTALTLNSPITIEGVANGSDNSSSPSELVACTPNPAAMVTINTAAHGSVLINFGIAAGTSTASATSGSAIIDYAEQTTIEHLVIPYACNAFLDIGNSTNFLYNRLTGNSFQPDCVAIQLGNASFSSIDPRIIGNTVDEAKPTGITANTNTVGMLLLNVGGAYVENNDILYEDYGTRILPTGTEVVSGGIFADTVVGDTTSYDCLDVAALSSTATASQLSFNHIWAGSCGNQARYGGGWGIAQGVWVVNSGGGNMQGIHFIGTRSTDVGANTFYTTGAISDLTLDGGSLCGANETNGGYFGAQIDHTAISVALRGVTIGATCDDNSGGPGVSADVNVVSGAGTVLLTDNNLVDGTLTGGPPAAGIIVNNKGIDDNFVNVPSAATVTAPMNPTITLTGGTTVSRISGGWPGRSLNILNAGGSVLAGGGNIVSVPSSFGVNQYISCIFATANWSCH
jgi:Pectate lyase superfamily protein